MNPLRLFLLAAAAALPFLSSCSQPPAAAPPLGLAKAYAPALDWKIGPFRMGMSAAAIKAAAPNLQWAQAPDETRPGAFKLIAPHALTFAGLPFDAAFKGVGAESGYAVEFRATAPAKTSQDCLAFMRALVDDLERTYGPFAPTSEGGNPALVFKAGNASRFDVWIEEDARLTAIERAKYWEAGAMIMEGKGEASIGAATSYEDNSDQAGGTTCVAIVDFTDNLPVSARRAPAP